MMDKQKLNSCSYIKLRFLTLNAYLTCLFIFICVFSSCIKTQSVDKDTKTKITDAERIGINGPVKSIKHKKYYNVKLEFGEVIEVEIEKEDNGIQIFPSNYLEVYNKQGNLSEKINYDPEGEVYEKERYFYDSDNNLIKSISADKICRYEYNSEGVRIQKDCKVLKGDYIYSSEPDTTVYILDSNGYIIEEKGYKDGKLKSRYVYEVDSLGNQLEYNWYDSDGSTYHKIPGLRLVRAINKRNSKGKVEERIHYIRVLERIDKDVFRYEYNEFGYIMKTLHLRSDSEYFKYEYEYEYDEYNNWIKQVRYEVTQSEKMPTEMNKRKIEYYEMK